MGRKNAANIKKHSEKLHQAAAKIRENDDARRLKLASIMKKYHDGK